MSKILITGAAVHVGFAYQASPDRCSLPHRKPPPLGYFAVTFRDAKVTTRSLSPSEDSAEG